MILSGVIFDSFLLPQLPVTARGTSRGRGALVRKGVLIGQEMGLEVLLLHLIMSAFEFVDELGGWF